uniref:M polyprotein n=1 Tax=Nairobi sheep disease virus TaxID=194540 RepID=D0PRM8_9VIRU|nr:glycoprotein precursor [Nairobi sheep disease virus]AED88227.1 glycoprotein precursor [Nairobi sheep disease virus]AMT75402.1 glycoprotein precursor [Ganjam virus]
MALVAKGLILMLLLYMFKASEVNLELPSWNSTEGTEYADELPTEPPSEEEPKLAAVSTVTTPAPPKESTEDTIESPDGGETMAPTTPAPVTDSASKLEEEPGTTQQAQSTQMQNSQAPIGMPEAWSTSPSRVGRKPLSASPDVSEPDQNTEAQTHPPVFLDGRPVEEEEHSVGTRDVASDLREYNQMKQLLSQRILAKMGMAVDFTDDELDTWCYRRYSNCSSNDIESRIRDFFLITDRSECFDEVLVKRLCETTSPIIDRAWKIAGLKEEVVLREMGRRIFRFFTPALKVTCMSGSLNPSNQFVRFYNPTLERTSGPTIQNYDGMHCLNIENGLIKPSKVVVINVLMTTVDIRLESCRAFINAQQCTYTQHADGLVRVPTFVGPHGEKRIIGAYTMSFNLTDEKNKACTIKTTCVVKGKEVKKGQSQLRGFPTTIRLFKSVTGKRRLMSNEEEWTECGSGTQLNMATAVSVHNDKLGGPGKKLTICNGTTVSDIALNEGLGCYTINKIITGKVCKTGNTTGSCEVQPELQKCETGKCILIKQKNKGVVKLKRGKTVIITECQGSCLFAIPQDTGDITIDCSGGRQHYLEINIVDIHCPGKDKWKGFMLYICRVSSRPLVALTFGIWLTAGYLITCLASFILYNAILLISIAIKKLKQKREKKGDLCIKCEQHCMNLYDQELHELNCSFNLCPYCANRLSDDGLPRHVPRCPKRGERLEEIELYINYTRVPCLLRWALSTSVQVGTVIKRLSWFGVLLTLFFLTISPVQGFPLENPPIGTATDSNIIYGLAGFIFALVLMLNLKKTHYGSVFHVIDGLGLCSLCDTRIDSLMEETAHELCCAFDCCPYCHQVSESNGSHCFHMRICVSKEISKKMLKAAGKLFTNKLVSREGFFANKIQLLYQRSKVVSTLILTVLLLLIILKPAAAFDSGPLPDGTWEEEESLIRSCDQECVLEQDECLCPGEHRAGRRLLFLSGLQDAARRMTESHRLLTSVSIDAPWGAINIESTFKPLLAASNIDLSWNSAEEQGDKIVLSGRSTGIIKLQERTGLMWKMSSEKASESKNLLVSIMDFSQLYNSIFQYITGDRSLSEWPKAVCTGECPDRCGCQTSTCYHKEWPHTRNWRCNPTWCWGIGTGCTCCGMDVERYFNKYFGVKWALEYVRTDVVVCVELTNEERHCDLVQAGSRFSIGPVSVTLSDPQNVVNRLSSSIMTIQEISDNGILDVMHVSKVISAENACKLQSCTHGSPGDLQILHTDNLIKGEMSSGINLAHLDPQVNTSWMSWEGCDLDYFCTVGDWPSCTYTGVNSINTDSFTNLINTETDYTSKFHFHSKRISARGDTLQMDLKARPNVGGGEMTVLVEVNGLELHSKKISLKGLKLSNLKCSGCFACSPGLSCTVIARLESPDEFTIHLRSTSRDVVVAETSVTARKAETGAKSSFRAFAVKDVKEICLEVVEKEYCPSCSIEDLKICISVTLEPPKDILIEHKGTIVQHYNKSCDEGYNCWIGSVSGFFVGVKDFFEKNFGSVIIGIVSTVLPLILTVLFFVYGRRLFCLCRLCHKKCCRGSSRGRDGYSRLSQEEEIKEIIKKFNRNGELLGRGENDKRTVARMFMDSQSARKAVKEVA